MKLKLLFLLGFVTFYAQSQIPLDDHKRYLFTSSSLANTASTSPSYNFSTSTYVNPVTFVNDRDAVANNAISLNGTRLNGGNVSTTNSQASNQIIAYSFWLKTSATTQAELLNQWRQSTSQGVQLRLEANGKISCYVKYRSHGGFGYNADSSYESTSVINDGQWHHVVFQVFREVNPSDSNQYHYKTELYVDGAIENSTQTGDLDNSMIIGIWDTGTAANIRELYFGALQNGGWVYYDQLDDIRIYERRLTSNEVIYLSGGTPPPVVNIPDPYFKQYLVNDTSINTNEDTEIQVSEAIAFTGSISVLDANITDFTGLEAFENITYFFTEYAQVTSIDFTQNVDLQYIGVGDTFLLSNITLPSTNSLLTLYLQSNQLASIDLSNVPNLTSLNIKENSFTTIDLSSVTNLVSLNVSNNNFTSLDVSMLTGLTSFASRFNNNLSSLDLRNSNNTAITSYDARNCPNLTCVFVDDKIYSMTTWNATTDPASNYVETTAECNLLSTSTFNNTSFQLFPNPVRNILTINSKEPVKNMQVYTTIGEKVIDEKDTKTINVSSLAKGVYIINVETNDGKIGIQKFVKN